MFPAFGRQGSSSTDVTEASVRRVIVSRTDTPEGDTCIAKEKMPNGKNPTF